MLKHLYALIVLGSALSAAGPAAAQQAFTSPETAVERFVAAVRGNDRPALRTMLGPSGDQLIQSGDRQADAGERSRFLAAYDEKHQLVTEDTDRATLVIGPNDWPFPIPLVQSAKGWRFDSAAGVQELIDRRVGANELTTIVVCLAYVEAQRDFASRNNGAYAERLMSDDGKQDGLYWPAAAGQAESPLGRLVEHAVAEGYPSDSIPGRPALYHGYRYKLLRAQGAEADDGAKSYFKAGRMTEGFALLAWPAQYGTSGLVSFIVNQDGLIYQRDLGPDTVRLAAETALFNPDPGWAYVGINE